jgi:probable HAF family extracellular repeat protein
MMTGLALLALAVAAAGVPRPARAEILYILKDLGTLGGTSSGGFGVNASGQVTGFAQTAGGASHAFLSGPGGGAILSSLRCRQRWWTLAPIRRAEATGASDGSAGLGAPARRRVIALGEAGP